MFTIEWVMALSPTARAEAGFPQRTLQTEGERGVYY